MINVVKTTQLGHRPTSTSSLVTRCQLELDHESIARRTKVSPGDCPGDWPAALGARYRRIHRKSELRDREAGAGQDHPTGRWQLGLCGMSVVFVQTFLEFGGLRLMTTNDTMIEISIPGTIQGHRGDSRFQG